MLYSLQENWRRDRDPQVPVQRGQLVVLRGVVSLLANGTGMAAVFVICIPCQMTVISRS